METERRQREAKEPKEYRAGRRRRGKEATTSVVVKDEPEHKVKLEIESKGVNALLAAADTISRGKPPTNEQVELLLEEVKKGIAEQEKTAEKAAGPQAKKLVEDIKNLIDDLETFIAEKNKGNRLQKIIEKGIETAKEVKEVTAPKGRAAKKKAQAVTADVQEMLQAMKNLSLQLIYSREFRSLMLDFIDFIAAVGHRITEEQVKPEKAEEVGEPTFEITEESPEPSVKAEAKKKAKEAARTFAEAWQPKKEKTTEIPSGREVAEKTKEKIKSLVDELRSGKYTPQEQKELIKERARTLLQQLGSNPEYRKAVKNLFGIIEYLYNVGAQAAEKAKKDTEKKGLHDKVVSLWEEIKSMIEEFTDEQPIDPLVEEIQGLFYEARDDEELRDFFLDAKVFIMTSLEHPEVLKRKNFKHGEELIDRFRDIVQSERYQERWRAIMDGLKDVLNKIAQDTMTQQVSEDIKELTRDLMLDEEGSLSFGKIQNSFMLIRSMLGPVILKQLEMIPIPKIVGSTPKYDYTVENLVFNGKEVIPEHFFFDIRSTGAVQIKELMTERGRTIIRLDFRNVKAHLRDVKFWFRRKKTPSYEDRGVVDLNINDASLGIDLIAETSDKITWHFAAAKVECSLGKSNITVKDAEHNVIDKFSSKVFSLPIKHAIEEKVEDTVLEYVTRFLTTVNSAIFSAVKQTKEVAHRAQQYTSFRPTVESA